MAVESVTKALQNAKIPLQKVDQACVGYVYGNGSFNTQMSNTIYINIL